MQRFRWVALQGSARGLLSPLLLLLAVHLSTSGIPAVAADDPAACTSPFARIVSIQGSVEVLRAGQIGAGQSGTGQSGWAKVTRLDTPICEGDRLRTGALSRAALFIQPETLVRVDQHTRISLSQTAEETLVEFIQDEILPASATPNACGAGYFITRFPRKFKVNTPHLNAAVEGTEFLVAMRCEATDLSVFEGKVLAASAGTDVFPPQTISSGQTLTIGGADPPAIKLLVKPADAVQWVLYYPPLSDARAEADLPTPDQCRSLPKPLNQTCLSQHAELLMRLGQIDEAQREIDEAVTLDNQDGEANALRAVILIARNEKAGALEAATSATVAAPNAYRSWLALSYAQQAAFKLDDALESARKAQTLEPNSSLTNARVAELLMSLGRIKEAERAAQAAVDANPAESRARTVLGFVRLAQIKIKVAREDFQAAIQRDSSDPLPRLGLGLAIIRTGKLAEGREQLEIAVALDPTNSLLRSYVGKAYYEENTTERDQLASTQFELAKQLDSNDPTSWFYAAMLNQSRNQPIDALEDLQTSVSKNDNRAVYRSKLLLDDDTAARNSGIAAIYERLGFEKLAIQESTKALAENPGDHSAHRLLASTYANLPRHDIARVSEALQAQLRQPLSLPWVDPIISTDNLLMLRDNGPSRLSQNELTQMFNQNQVRLLLDAISGSQKTLGNQFVAAGLYEKAAVSFSQMHYETIGFGENDAATRNAYDFFAHGQIEHDTSVQLNIKSTTLEAGQTFFAFDPLFTQSNVISDDGYSWRISLRHVQETGSDWIVTAAQEYSERIAKDSPTGFIFNQTDIDTSAIELQHLLRAGGLHVISGGGFIEKYEDFVLYQSSTNTQSTNVYSYGNWSVTDDIHLTVGFSGEWFRVTSLFLSEPFERRNFSPKLGLVLSPTPTTTIRVAAFSSLRRPFIQSQTIEPTQIAGFNQFFTGFEQFYGDIEGTVARRIGVAIDQTLSQSTFVGLGTSRRKLEVPLIPLDPNFTWRETAAHSYLYHAIRQGRALSSFGGMSASITLEAEFERIERPQELTGPEAIMELETLSIPAGIRLFNGQALTLRTGATYIRQKGDFSIDVGLPIVSTNESAWIADASIEYQLPNRKGLIAIGSRNIFDRALDLVETDPFNPRVATGRFSYVKARLLF